MASRDSVLHHRCSRTITALCAVAAIVMLGLSGNSLAWLSQSGPVPQINLDSAVFDSEGGRLIVKGQNF